MVSKAFAYIFSLFAFHSFLPLKCYSLISQLSKARYFKPNHICLEIQATTDTSSPSSNDISLKYTRFERLLFDMFASSVTEESQLSTPPNTYKQLIASISAMVFNEKNVSIVHDKGKNILVRLFPPFILPLYRLSFAKFPEFSAFMNVWVTHFTTSWLMGNSSIYDIELENGLILQQKGLLVEKCAFLEEAGCLRTCLHACKIPTQRFFFEEMGLPVTLKPNVTDYSCRFEFNIMSLPLEQDEISKAPCLDICAHAKRKKSNKNAYDSISSSGNRYKEVDTAASDKRIQSLLGISSTDSQDNSMNAEVTDVSCDELIV